MTRKLPLEGIRIVDTSHVFAIPYAMALMGDLGAEVIKVASHVRLDVMTDLGPFPENQPGERYWDQVGSLNALNRSKLGIAVDLTKPKGQEIFRQLTKRADVVAEAFTPRVMKGFGLDYESLKKVKPNIIMVSNSGFGQTGPWSSYGSVATSMEATSGMAYLSGYLDGPPAKIGQSHTDFLVAWTAVFAVLAALHHRRRTGQGQWIELSLYEMWASSIAEALLDYTANGRVQGRMGNRHTSNAPQGCYRSKGNDEWITISVATDQEWRALCDALGKPELVNDARFADSLSRWHHQDELDPIIQEWTSTVGHYEAMEVLQKAGVPAGPVLNNKELLLDPQMRARGFYEKVTHPPAAGVGTRPYIGRPWKFSKTPGHIQKAAPMLGEDNERVLMGLLGMSREEYDSLLQEGIIGNAPNGRRPPQALPIADMQRLHRIGEHDVDYKEVLGIEEDPKVE